MKKPKLVAFIERLLIVSKEIFRPTKGYLPSLHYLCGQTDQLKIEFILEELVGSGQKLNPSKLLETINLTTISFEDLRKYKSSIIKFNP